ncbi:MAG: hypothetical protein GY742_11415 [Hyphomicrobiales bacterium]|nr:hypothetical protein [Hyphomicrobiales bacterium]
MKKKTISILVFALLIFILLRMIGCSWVRPHYQWNYKLSIEVETTSGPLSAHSVIGVKANPANFMRRQFDGYEFDITGEAVVLEIPVNGVKQYLFLLLKSLKRHSKAATIAAIAYADELGEMDARSVHINPVANYDWLPMVKKLRGKPAAILKTDTYPLLVTFTDINDPASVVRVDPYDLEKHFGTGVKLKAVTLEITGEPVTKGEVEKVTGWWKKENKPANFTGPMWDWKHPEFDISKAIRIRDFIRGGS